MCGINGIVNFNNHSISVSDLDRFQESLNSMKSRGPDSQALCQGPNWVLGHTRLSIIDIEGGVQPMKDPATGVTVSYNGEIYNFQELKNELIGKGYSFSTSSDTEVLLYSYIEWGVDAVKRFNGCFAFAVADPVKEQVLLFRDRLGIKPLYYIYEEGRLVFASSVAAILKIIGKREIDKASLSHYFTSCRISFGDRTLLEGIHSLLPAHFVKFQMNGEEKAVVQYWQRPILTDAEKTEASEEELFEETRSLVEAAVQRRLISDVPVGCFLSGGLDSAIVATMATKENKYPLYCAGSTVEKYNEFQYAAEVAKGIDCSVENVVMDSSKFFDDWKMLINQKGLPLSTPNEASIYRLSKKLSETCKVTLTGEGADEIFGGYLMPQYGIYDFLKAPKSEAEANGHPLEYKLTQRFGRPFFFNEADHFFLTHSWMPFETKMSLFEESFSEQLDDDDEVFSFYEDFLEKYSKCTPFDRRMHLHTEINLEGLLNRVDSSTMAASVEARVPFTDHLLVEYVFKQKDSWKMCLKPNAGSVDDLLVDELNAKDLVETKRLLRNTFKKNLPSSIFDRKKMSFPTPFQEWLGDSQTNNLQRSCLEINKRVGIFNDREIQQLFKRKDRNIWLLANVCFWLESLGY